ncbi:MAG: 2-phosphosulfolactate phosphatase [Steroidobacteraceae bacterium]
MATPQEITQGSGGAVVIDVLRAFTVTAWAFHLGAERIVLLRGLDEALALKARTPGALAFQDGEPLPGFDLANSPVRIEQLALRGRTIFQRTTAGTQGANAAAHCRPLLCTGFATARATAAYLRRHPGVDWNFVPTGDGGQAIEDIACAQYIEALVADPATPGAPFLDRARRSRAARDLQAAAERGHGGVDRGDVARCLEADRFDFAMCAAPEDGLLTLRPARA